MMRRNLPRGWTVAARTLILLAAVAAALATALIRWSGIPGGIH